MGINLRRTFLGYGSKVEGMALVYKREYTLGWAFNLAAPHINFDFEIKGTGWGLGLGGGTNIAVLLNFNEYGPPARKELDDFSFDFSVGGKWSKLADALTKYRVYAALASIGGPNVLSQLAELREFASAAYEIFDVADGVPTMVTMDLPVGIGLEVSVSKISGTLQRR